MKPAGGDAPFPELVQPYPGTPSLVRVLFGNFFENKNTAAAIIGIILVFAVCYVTEMVCWAAGGPLQYTGRSMRDSHQRLMITAAEWEAFWDDFQRTLDKCGVPQAEQAALKAIAASTRVDIVV